MSYILAIALILLILWLTVAILKVAIKLAFFLIIAGVVVFIVMTLFTGITLALIVPAALVVAGIICSVAGN